jgi:hypothetical protein
LIELLSFSMRRKHACVSSTGDTLLLRNNSEDCFKVSDVISCMSAFAVVQVEAMAPTPWAMKFLRD